MRPGFFKSSFSGAAGPCVAVKFNDDSVEVTHSKKDALTPIVYTNDEWDAFIKGVKNDEFNRPNA